jgi:hypothetical protein
MLQAGRSRVRIPMRSLAFFSRRHVSSRTVALGSTQPLTEMSARIIPGGGGERATGLKGRKLHRPQVADWL